LPQLPVTPEEASGGEIQKLIAGFMINLESTFKTFFNNDVQLPLWKPPLGQDGDWSHITGLKIPVISRSSQIPSLLLHNLGQPSHDAQLVERVDTLFRPEPQQNR
jgi:hypothetical protein